VTPKSLSEAEQPLLEPLLSHKQRKPPKQFTMVQLTRLLVLAVVAVSFVYSSDLEEEEDLFGGPNLITPDQEEYVEDTNPSYFGRLLAWVAGDENEGSSLRGSQRSLWGWNTGTGDCKSRFWSSCSSRDQFTTGNNVYSAPGRPTSTRPPQVLITSLLQASGQFGDLLTLVTAAGLVDTLASAGPWTVFAPTDEAFKWYNIDDAAASPDLGRILTYHVVAGEYKASDLSDGTQLTTVEGQNITISIPAGGKPKINCESTITMVDLEGSNGVIHTIGWPLNVFTGNVATCP
jgi:uncharacterized surface protein with fasciclin (FAS1) repeats